MACRAEPIRFSVPGMPQGKQRARTFFDGRKYASVTPEKTRAYEDSVRLAYRAAGGVHMGEGPIFIRICACFPIPKSASRGIRALMEQAAILPTRKPDVDNIAKIICDALNGLAYGDDAQVVSCAVSKRYAAEPSVLVELWPGGELRAETEAEGSE